MHDPPDIANRGQASDELMLRRQWNHVEITHCKGQMATFGGPTEQLGHLPRLCSTVAEIRVVWFTALVRRVGVGVEDLDDLFRSRAIADLCVCDTFANIPITTPKGRWTTVQGVAIHGTLLNGPTRKDGQSSAKGRAMVEFAIWENQPCLAADALVVFLGKTLLKSDNMRLGAGYGQLATDFRDPFSSELGDVLETPAVECDEVEIIRQVLHFWPLRNNVICEFAMGLIKLKNLECKGSENLALRPHLPTLNCAYGGFDAQPGFGTKVTCSWRNSARS